MHTQASPNTTTWSVVRQSRWGRLVQHADRPVALFERSLIPCATEDDAHALVETLLGGIRDEHADCGLVLDVRLARGNNAPFFEEIFVEAIKVITQSYARVVFVVTTMSGMLQVIRLQRSWNGVEECVTHDPARAIAFAAGERSLE